jgi:hypothetical protein
MKLIDFDQHGAQAPTRGWWAGVMQPYDDSRGSCHQYRVVLAAPELAKVISLSEDIPGSRDIHVTFCRDGFGEGNDRLPAWGTGPHPRLVGRGDAAI